jgi:DNA-binding LacI/PurR family transcriptional regulator
MAIGALKTVADRGLRVPEDVSVVGFDDQPEAAFFLIPLTTVRQDFAAITRRAIEELVAMIAGGEASAPVTYLPAELVVRASSGRARRRNAVPLT